MHSLAPSVLSRILVRRRCICERVRSLMTRPSVTGFLLLIMLTGCQQAKPPQLAEQNDASREAPTVESENHQDFQTSPEGIAEFETQYAMLTTGETQQIRLDASRISPQDLNKLISQTGLLDLLLDNGGVNDQQMALVAKMSSLEHLRIRQSELTDDGIATLCSGDLPNLRILNLPQAALTAQGIRSLQQLPALTNLRLGGTSIDDEAAYEIAKLSELKSLHLIGPSITGVGLAHLARAPKLASFYLDDCKIADSDWEVLFEAKPNIHVHIDQHHHDRDPGKHSH